MYLISEVLLGMFSHQAALIKFAWVNQLVHEIESEIRPLYALTHLSGCDGQAGSLPSRPVVLFRSVPQVHGCSRWLLLDEPPETC